MQSQIDHFLDTLDRSPHTVETYRYALKRFVSIVGEDAPLDSDTYETFLTAIKKYQPSTKQVWRSAVLGFYAFCKSGNWAEIKGLTKHYSRKQGQRIVKFNREAIEKLIAYCDVLALHEGDDQLFALRDRAFILTLVDTGLRISEACALKRGDIDWQEHYAIIIGKGDKQAVVRFSERSIRALKDYLTVRARVDPNSRTSLASQPLFASHDIRASKRLTPIGAGGMWRAIKGTSRGHDDFILGRMAEAGIDRKLIRIHDLRHYFVTMTLLALGDLKMSQELARHSSISQTAHYAHLGGKADEAYDLIFNQHK